MKNKQGGRSKYRNKVGPVTGLLQTRMQVRGKAEQSPDSFPMGGSLRLQEEHFTRDSLKDCVRP